MEEMFLFRLFYIKKPKIQAFPQKKLKKHPLYK